MSNVMRDIENEILAFWKEHNIFKKSVEQRTGATDFVFYEGPPTANAKPALHHIPARAFKDVLCRFKTMRGYRVVRKGGWDTHGLPVELQIEKKLGLNTKQDIENYGVELFNAECKASVWNFVQDWQDLTERIGYWIDMDDPYVTYTPEYMESVWYLLKQIEKKKLLFEDFKVVPWCTRCGTGLSSHEVAQGYKEITERAVYVLFKVKVGQSVGNFKTDAATFLMSWTTTPWTLPGNVALAVKQDIDYVVADIAGKYIILAKNRLQGLADEVKVVAEVKGSELAGLAYEPLFNIPELQNDKSHHVYPADFVTDTDGSGIVHTAVMYGVDDFTLGSQVGLPKVHTVQKDGTFADFVPHLRGTYVKDQATEQLILELLKKEGNLFVEEQYTHDYPYCWRCSTPLLYYAKDSWFIRMTELKDQLLKNNDQINWHPGHIKEGRFGEWLRELKDWALSRERYWGTPLPVWRCERCDSKVHIGSMKELMQQRFTTNTYYFLRHGETPYQAEQRGVYYPPPERDQVPITDKARENIQRTAQQLKGKKITKIISSDLLRAKQTAEIVAKELGCEVVYDERLRDIHLGIYHDQPIAKFKEEFLPNNDFFVDVPEGGESRADCAYRVLEAVRDIDQQHENERILIVSHKTPIWSLQQSLGAGEFPKKNLRDIEYRGPKPAELLTFPVRFLPLNRLGELDLHRPYIDHVHFICPHCPSRMRRVSDVIDVWFDSGAMPFAQYHWPFRTGAPGKYPPLFPANYISEGIDQTRGWFYTLLAISTVMGHGPAYRNVISLGHVLDKNGAKMSKSKGNIIDPWEALSEYGTDAIRWYFYTVNQPGDSKLFADREIKESLRKFVMTLWNSFVFYRTYTPQGSDPTRVSVSAHVLDQWILSKVNRVTQQVTDAMDAYDVTKAARTLEQFVSEDVSQWYVRRSRRRFQQPSTIDDAQHAAATLHQVLVHTALLAAPFVPFIAEKIHRELNNFKSVHLEKWPRVNKKLISNDTEAQMQRVREVVSLGMKKRAEAKIKVRQPLQEVGVKDASLAQPGLIEQIREELNVREVTFAEGLEEDVVLDTEITPELLAEGHAREIIRRVQLLRKDAGLFQSDSIIIKAKADAAITELLHARKEFICKETSAFDIVLHNDASQLPDAVEMDIAGANLLVSIQKT